MDFQTLNHLFMSSKNFSHQRIRSLAMTDTECMLCSYIHAHPGCSQEDAVRALRFDKTTAGKALQKLEVKGYVAREQGTGDHRKKELHITEQGTARIEGITDLHDHWLSTVMSCLTEEEKKQFEGYCLRLLAEADKLAEKQRND